MNAQMMLETQLQSFVMKSSNDKSMKYTGELLSPANKAFNDVRDRELEAGKGFTALTEVSRSPRKSFTSMLQASSVNHSPPSPLGEEVDGDQFNLVKNLRLINNEKEERLLIK